MQHNYGWWRSKKHGTVFPIVKIMRSWRLIFIMGIRISIRRCLYIYSASEFCIMVWHLEYRIWNVHVALLVTPLSSHVTAGLDLQEWTQRVALQWCHNERDGVPNHQPHDWLLKRLFTRRSKKTSKLRVTGLCEGNSPVTCEFPAQRASNAENVSIRWRHHGNLHTVIPSSSIPWFSLQTWRFV